jgi:hypothetical protein
MKVRMLAAATNLGSLAPVSRDDLPPRARH